MSIDDDIALLDRIPTFQMLGRDALRIIAIGAESRIVRGGDILFREGQSGDSGYVVVSGTFALTQERRSRRRDGPQTVGPGTLMGELALLTDCKRPATATATELSTVLRIPRSIFLRTLESYPDAAARVARMIRDRIAGTLTDLDAVRQRLEAIEPPPRAPGRPLGR
ncbi:cyclic nucleotide-binding domain-containing protein [Ancylobacter terrae]|uniref:cyclic nucleotide-binding domain-containing protein n=1 Tax=Ancylobacter sp. sgz301288 TaxID=3342077 RepID=UPI00385B11B0